MRDLTHVSTIRFILFIYIVIFIFRFQLKPYRKQIRLFIGTLLILSRLNLDIWYVLTGTWSVQQALPIELCSIASLAVGIMLLTKNRFLFETFYFIGIAGAIQVRCDDCLNRTSNADKIKCFLLKTAFYLKHFILLALLVRFKQSSHLTCYLASHNFAFYNFLLIISYLYLAR